jgi:hypothetical protein
MPPALESIFRPLLVLSSPELYPVDQQDLLSFGEMKLILREWLARDEHHDRDASYQMELTGKVTVRASQHESSGESKMQDSNRVIEERGKVKLNESKTPSQTKDVGIIAWWAHRKIEEGFRCSVRGEFGLTPKTNCLRGEEFRREQVLVGSPRAEIANRWDWADHNGRRDFFRHRQDRFRLGREQEGRGKRERKISNYTRKVRRNWASGAMVEW